MPALSLSRYRRWVPTLASFATHGPNQCSSLPVVRYDARTLLSELGPGFRLREEQSERHLTPNQRAQEFTYFRLILARKSS